jgi:hypothetical protein
MKKSHSNLWYLSFTDNTIRFWDDEEEILAKKWPEIWPSHEA